jgi:hypothetical protein
MLILKPHQFPLLAFLFWVTWHSPAHCTGATQGKKPTTVIKVIDFSNFARQGGFEINVEPDGNFYDPLGYRISKKKLAKYLRKPSPGDTSTTSYISVFVVDDKKTPVEVVGKALRTVRAAADKRKRTVIFLILFSFSYKHGSSEKKE